MKRFARLVSLIACLPLGSAIAGDFDGSKLLICAVAEAMDCVSSEPCAKGLPTAFGLPTFMRVDFDNKTVAGPLRTTPIQLMEKSDRQILLQGTELGYAWTLALDTQDGILSGAITDRTGVFALFGSCTPL